MKLAIFLDQDGHFRAININNKDRVMKTMMEFDGGDLWDNEWHHIFNIYRSPIASKPEGTFEEFLTDCTQRGVFEVIEYEEKA